MSFQRIKINIERVGAYIQEAMKFKNAYPANYSIFDVIRFFPSWFMSLRFGANPMRDQRPWMTFSAIEFIQKRMRKNMRVFEYGSGGSTLFLALGGCEVFSVEHEKSWYNVVMSEIHKRKLFNCRLFLAEAEDAPAGSFYSAGRPAECMSEDSNFRGKTFKKYVHKIDEYPDGYFDLVIIDGRARNSCFLSAIAKVKKGGFVLWDNTERKAYSDLVEADHEGLEFIDLPGPSPYVSFFTRTSAWRKLY